MQADIIKRCHCENTHRLEPTYISVQSASKLTTFSKIMLMIFPKTTNFMNNIYQIAEKNLPASSWLEQPHSQEEKLCAPFVQAEISHQEWRFV